MDIIKITQINRDQKHTIIIIHCDVMKTSMNFPYLCSLILTIVSALGFLRPQN